jgi:hypothetical protein
MNNCYQDFAVRSARELGDLLDLDLGEIGTASLP